MKTAVVTIASPLEKRYLKEFVAWHIDVLKFNKVFIYANDWPIETSWSFLGEYAYAVCIIRIGGLCQQLNAYNDFINVFGAGFDWAAFIDVDEFICLKKDTGISQFLAKYDNANAVAVNWKLFGSNGKEHYEDLPVIQRFTKSQIGVNQHVKTLVHLSRQRQGMMFFNPHFANAIAATPEGLPVAGPFNPRGTDNIAYIAHYATKSKDECFERRSYRRADTGIPRDNLEAFFEEHNRNDVDNYDLQEKFSKICKKLSICDLTKSN